MLKKLKNKKIITSLLLLTTVVVVYVIYKSVDPLESAFMPKCFSYTLFGIKCPGCGTQRALHSLFCGDLVNAIRFNPLLILSVPYIIVVSLLEINSVKTKYPKLHKALLGERAIWILLILLAIYTIVRNFFDF